MSATRIAGVGATPFGVYPDRLGRDLFAEAAQEALDDAGIPRTDIDEVFYGNFIGELTESQGHQGPLMAESAGVTAPATRIENACASGGSAMRMGVHAIKSGSADVVLVGGMERMNNVSTADVTDALAMAADSVFERRVGMTFPGAYALMMRSYLEEHGGSREDLAAIAVKNHANALSNSYAHIHKEIEIDDVLDAPMIADPVGLYDACPITDGAAAVLLVSERYAAESGVSTPVEVTGSGQHSDHLSLQKRADLTKTPAAARAAECAYEDAGIDATAVDVAEVHDCFTIAEVLALEALGFYEHGEGIHAAFNGETTRSGSIPVNLSGGLKAKGHPVGATGVSQVAEMTRLLRGDHPNSDAVPTARIGLTHNAGGTAASAVVHILEVVE